METLAFIHAAVAYEDPTPESELRSFDDISLKAPGSIALGVLSAGVITATLSHADQAQALIRYGNAGTGVAQLQQKLGISADGVFGPQTYNSLIAFQQRNRLRVDGIAGPQTLPALGLSGSLGPGSSTSPSGPGAPIGSGAYVTARIGLRVRSSPGGSVVGGLPYGARVSLTGNTRGGWSELTSGDWVASQYIGFSSFAREPGVVSGPYAAARSGLRVRSSPSFGNNVVGGLPYGARLSLTGNTQNGWSQLTNGDWVSSQHIGFPSF